MNGIGHRRNSLFLVWLIWFGVMLFAVAFVWQRGLFGLLLEGDPSYLSGVILGAFALANVHVAYRALALSRDIDAVLRARSNFEAQPDEPLFAEQGPQFRNLSVPPSLIMRHFQNLFVRAMREPSRHDLGQQELLEALTLRLKSGIHGGWLVADTMLKLGLLGTVIGFIVMLGAIASLENYDLTTMQGLLTSMSGGMRIALYTTLSGMIAALLLAVQYQYLERRADGLIADIQELTAVYYVSALRRHLNEHHAP
jgi:hypothetical protein